MTDDKEWYWLQMMTIAAQVRLSMSADMIIIQFFLVIVHWPDHKQLPPISQKPHDTNSSTDNWEILKTSTHPTRSKVGLF